MKWKIVVTDTLGRYPTLANSKASYWIMNSNILQIRTINCGGIEACYYVRYFPTISQLFACVSIARTRTSSIYSVSLFSIPYRLAVYTDTTHRIGERKTCAAIKKKEQGHALFTCFTQQIATPAGRQRRDNQQGIQQHQRRLLQEMTTFTCITSCSHSLRLHRSFPPFFRVHPLP